MNTFYAVLYYQYEYGTKPCLTEPRLMTVYCKNPRFNDKGGLSKSCRYYTHPNPVRYVNDVPYTHEHGEFFVTEEEAQQRYNTLKDQYEVQEARCASLRGESKRLMLEALTPLITQAKRLPQEVGPETPRISDSDSEFQIQFSPRELAILEIAFPGEQWFWCRYHISYYPANLREFDPAAYVNLVREKIETLTTSLTRVADFMETHGDGLRTIFGPLYGDTVDC